MRKLFILSLLAMMIALGIGGCGGGEGTSADPLGTDSMMFGHKNDAAGTDWSTAMAVNPRGTVILTAKLKNASDKPVIGREVTFGFVSNASGATLSSTKASTDAAGEAMTLYTAGMGAGFDVVRASISNGATLDTNITVASVGAAELQIALDGSPTALSAGQVSIITATVTSISGSTSTPAGGVTVSFTLPVNNSGATLSAATATTDGSGKAVVIYQPGPNTPTIDVQDTVQAAVGTATDAVAITRTGSSTLAFSITVSALPATLATNAASSVVTANVKNNLGTAVSGVTVNFAVTGVLPLGTLSVASATTDGSGNAVTTFTGNGAGAAGATSVVTASVTVSGNTYTNAVIITYPSYAVSISPSPASVTVGQVSIVTATVTSISGSTSTPAGGVTVTFSLPVNNSVASLSALSAVTDGSGNAVVTYTAGANNPTLTVEDVVQAAVGTATNAVPITRTGSSASAFSITVGALPATVTAGQVSIITATVTSGPVYAAGVTVSFTLPVNLNQSGATLSAATATTDGSGKAVVVYQPGTTSPTLTVQDTVQAAVGTATAAVPITRTGSAASAYGIAVTASPAALTADNSNSVVNATVTYGTTAISGVTVTFTVTGGGTVPAPGTATTDGSGNAVIIFTGGPAARATGETDVVTASITVGGNTYTNAVVITYP